MVEDNTNVVKAKKKKGPIREWFDSVLFAVVAATLIRWLFFEAYTIPTGSMERSLLVNDFLFVSKLHYGSRVPMTPLQVPLTHQKIWFTDAASYSDAIQLPYLRLPGFTSIKNNDVVVFNYPGDPFRTPYDPFAKDGHSAHPVDLRTNYIKRCIGVGGDKLEIKNGQVYLNDKPAENPEGMQMYYNVESTTQVNQKLFDKYYITKKSENMANGKHYYIINATDEAVANIKTLDFISNVSLEIIPKDDSLTPYRTFPYSYDMLPWNRDNFGPLVVPKEGMTVELNAKNTALYRGIITTFDHNENAEYKDGKLFVDGKQITNYTFRQNYYFMMGDNRYESDDSRFWGFVPEDHVVGKAAFIWMSIDSEGTFLNKIRWNRLFSGIK